ncbi:unnamed protein product [Dimorphilus gyrociliatus]|uniref:IRF tryptophan pentad repeat domain-containing protein n=1 Tax=Dimorphilus gyrociliatus TaxID=2664684 RepID=A0A7I8VTN2_9ANNE|nr:unnamed protein product [Dimorphilus gyrociliatus]
MNTCDKSLIPTVVEEFGLSKMEKLSIPTPIMNPKGSLPCIQQKKQFCNQKTLGGGSLLEVRQDQSESLEPLDLSTKAEKFCTLMAKDYIKNMVKYPPNSKSVLPQQGFVRSKKRDIEQSTETEINAASILASFQNQTPKSPFESDTEKEAAEALLSLSEGVSNRKIVKSSKYPKMKKLGPCPNLKPPIKPKQDSDELRREMEDVMQCGGPRPMDRLPLRPWLKKVLDLNCASGVQWMDKENGKFRVKWKHAARQGFSVDGDAELFKLWAIHTGKYNESKDKPDHKRWKANFRCAINSVSDLVEIKDAMHRQDGETYKVFQFLPEKAKKSLSCKPPIEPKLKKIKVECPSPRRLSNSNLQPVATYS